MRRYFCRGITVLLLAALLAGCGSVSDGGPGTDPATTGIPAESEQLPFIFTEADGEMFSDRDMRGQYANGIRVTLKGKSASADGDGVRISGSAVTLTGEGPYILSGTLDDGVIKVDASGSAKVHIVLEGASVTSSAGAALYIREADKVFVTLAEGTDNLLANGGSFAEAEDSKTDGAVFSRQDLTFNGTGRLTVTSPAGHGIVCKDDLVLTGGLYAISAASHGLDANDSIRIGPADMVITSGKDGIHAENSDDAELGFVYLSGARLNITAEGDGISAGSTLQVMQGDITVLAGGGYGNGTKAASSGWGSFPGGRQPGGFSASASSSDSTSMKGLKSGGNMGIFGGTVSVDSADDAIHAKASLMIAGGILSLATGDDGLHADENLDVSGGQIAITRSYEGMEAMHVHVSGGEVTLSADDDGVNAAGGTDSSGSSGGRDGMFGAPAGFGKPGGHGGMSSSKGSITISGGKLHIKSMGDGIDANGTLTISGGHTTVVGPVVGDTATLDYDVSGTITGGTFIGSGGQGMAQSFSAAEQGVIALRVGNREAGTTITLTDGEGNVLVDYAPELPFAVVILSSPEIVSGQTYHMTVGDTAAEVTAE